MCQQSILTNHILWKKNSWVKNPFTEQNAEDDLGVTDKNATLDTDDEKKLTANSRSLIARPKIILCLKDLKDRMNWFFFHVSFVYVLAQDIYC